MDPALTRRRVRPGLPGRARRAALALAALLVATGCAADPGPTAPTPPAPPAASAPTPGGDCARCAPAPADVPFLRAMVSHHDRTRVVAAAATGRITDVELRTLVAAVDVTEADELATMRRWLAAAPDGGVTAPAGHHPHHDAHDDVQGTQGAAATADPDLARLRAAPAGRFDAVLVEVLTAHQRAAVTLARAHLPVAVGPEVRDLADRIARSRAAQLRLLAGLPAA
ncbi:DUF305 domain-containing protein [Micromonospora haikouensis]|uniref:DUF305 domain-containing protein n=1 Tax=Micromonospora haikouensis TaxID=686309 RepID=UPI0036893C80